MNRPSPTRHALSAAGARLCRIAAAAMLLAGWSMPAPHALAQPAAWPKQPVRMIVPYSPGTGADILARTLGPRLSERFGQPGVVENRVGASGNIGTASVARAPADGYTLLMNVNSHVINRSVFKETGYEPIRDFAPVSMTAWGRLMLVANAGTGLRTANDLVKEARANPSRFNYASPGIGTPHHVAMEFFKQQTGIELLHVPHKATAGAVADLVGGQVQVMFLPIHVAMAQVRGGRLNALGIGSPKRDASAPEVPTLAEQGLKNIDTDMWYGLLVPAGTPREIVSALNRAVVEIMAQPEVRSGLAKQGLDATTSTPEAFGKLIEADLARWQRVVEQAKISANE
jgi:tripartite-type tricarboxylate transporter receptor subunit TctC